MQVAKLKTADINFQYRCPNCHLHFGLRNKQIPTKQKAIIECPSCRDKIVVLPVSIKIEKLSFESDKQKKFSQNEDRAIAALVAQGFTKREAKDLVLSVNNSLMPLPDLVAEALRRAK